jgi:hypothetical protein
MNEYTRRDAEKAEFKARIEELEKNRTDIVAENAELKARVVKLDRFAFILCVSCPRMC